MKCEGLLKVTGSHIQWKSGNISETIQDRHVVTESDIGIYTAYLIVAIVMTLCALLQSFSCAIFFVLVLLFFDSFLLLCTFDMCK